MAPAMEVPCLPQFRTAKPGAEARPLPQLLKIVTGVPGVYEDARESTLTDVPAGTVSAFDGPLDASEAKPHQVAVSEAPLRLPAWVAYDRKVLRFFAYFKEAVTERREENHRFRRCTIYYYLEDGSMRIDEPKEDNSGIPQGVFLKRHRVPKADGTPVSFEDFVIGGTLEVYGRSFNVLSCDAFTREFLTNSGITVNADVPFVTETPLAEYNKTFRGRPPPRASSLTFFLGGPNKKSLELDKKVLRFYAVWDDRESIYGDRHAYVFNYFLSDDTAEVLEVPSKNSGRDPFPKLLARMKVPKHVYGVGPNPQPTTNGEKPNQEYISFSDLGVGQIVEVFGRPLLLHDCDDFTKAFYINYCGRSETDFVPIKIKEFKVPAPKPKLPPRESSFGSEYDNMEGEDPAISKSFFPKRVQRDTRRFVEQEGKVLRFTANIKESAGGPKISAVDLSRTFVFSYFVYDSTVMIYEPPERNSGIVGGKFLERGVVKNPATSFKYRARDMYIGAEIVVFGRTFELVDADEWTITFMEENAWSYPKSDPAAIVDLVMADLVSKYDNSEAAMEMLQSCLLKHDYDGDGTIVLTELMPAMSDACPGVLTTRQECITLCRAFSANKSEMSMTIPDFIAAVKKDVDQALEMKKE